MTKKIITQEEKDILSNGKAKGNLSFSFLVTAVELLDASIIVKMSLKPPIISSFRWLEF